MSTRPPSGTRMGKPMHRRAYMLSYVLSACACIRVHTGVHVRRVCRTFSRENSGPDKEQ